jgi:putative effector of murein hydrolase
MTYGGDRRLFRLIIQFFVILTALLIGNAIVRFFHLPFSGSIVASLIPKSVTIPVALSVSEALGGIPSLTILFVLTSALFSLIIGPGCLERLRIKSKISKGLAMGACAQALGVGKSFQWGEEAGAIGSIGMTMSAVLVSFFIPILSMMM